MSISKKNNFLGFLFLMGLTSCHHCFTPESIEIPCRWYTQLENENSLDPAGFLWWEEFNDPLLNTLVEQAACKNSDVQLASVQSKEKSLQTINAISAEVAKNYIELRGWQNKLKNILSSLEAQKNIAILGEDLLNQGFINFMEQNEMQTTLHSLLVQETSTQLSIQKIIIHLSTLIESPLDCLYEILDTTQELPTLPVSMPVGIPCELVQRHPAVIEARNMYQKTCDKMTYYQYKKQVFTVLEDVEQALAAYARAQDKIFHLTSSKNLKWKSYQAILDLFHKGSKDELSALISYQEFLNAENEAIQAQVELLINYIHLYQALSTGWCCE